MNATSTTTTTTTTTGAAAATAHAIVNTKGANFEIIHKDIGYSSDADTSDATADATSSGFVGSSSVSSSASSLASDCNSCNKNIGSPDTSVNSTNTQKRKVVKKRKVSSKLIGSTSCSTLYTSKQRPWSFHAASEWTDWDYYQPPSFIPSNECISEFNFHMPPFSSSSSSFSLHLTTLSFYLKRRSLFNFLLPWLMHSHSASSSSSTWTSLSRTTHLFLWPWLKLRFACSLRQAVSYYLMFEKWRERGDVKLLCELFFALKVNK